MFVSKNFSTGAQTNVMLFDLDDPKYQLTNIKLYCDSSGAVDANARFTFCTVSPAGVHAPLVVVPLTPDTSTQQKVVEIGGLPVGYGLSVDWSGSSGGTPVYINGTAGVRQSNTPND